MSTAWFDAARLRAAFAQSLSRLYASEVPLYGLLVRTTEEVNAAVGGDGDLGRIGAERHGAIRLGTPEELRQAAAVFAAFGMHPVGFYDLRGGHDGGIPVVSTAFRPLRADELSRNPFRMFTSLLAVEDRRYFSPDLAQRLTAFLRRRQLFPPRLLELASRAETDRGLPSDEADELVRLATDAFRLSTEPIDLAWYTELDAVSSVAADIGGVAGTHLNHLTPRVLDIDLLYQRMTEQGVKMIDTIQGPPAGQGADVLLRQTSFRALAEPRRFRDQLGRSFHGELRVRFGEVESRGAALTAAGFQRYEAALRDAAATSGSLDQVWSRHFPSTLQDLFQQGLAPCTVQAVTGRRPDGRQPTDDVTQLLRDGFVEAHPIVYEDFLPRSAAGIFRSNLTGPLGRAADRTAEAEGCHLDRSWIAEVLQRPVPEPTELYADQQRQSVAATLSALDLQPTRTDLEDART